MTDDHLEELLRAALPPTSDDGPSRDLWPLLATRVDRAARWTILDVSLAAAVAIALLVFPEWLWLLAYHL